MKKLNILLIIAAGLLSAVGCKNNNLPIMSTVSGKAGEVIVVVENHYWNGTLGTTLRNILEKEYQVLPQSETMFDLVTVPPANFSRLFQSHRNIIMLVVAPEQSEPKIEVRRDVYAAPQIVIVVSGPDDARVAQLVVDEQVKITELLEQAERNRIISNAKKYQNHAVRNAVMQQFSGAPHFPDGYTLRKTAGHFMWIAYDTPAGIQGVLQFSYPYTGQSDFEIENMIAAQNAILKAQVPSSGEGSYMTVASSKPAKQRFIKHHELHFAELRGLWETTEPAYMGGPFVSHSFLNKEGTDIIVVFAFVYAPKTDKRNLLRQTEALLYSFEWATPPEEA